MKNKVKQMVCVVCAFVLSFMLTVTALASDDFESANGNFIGKYVCTDTLNFPTNCNIEVWENGYLQIRVYMDMEWHNYFSGSSDKWKISNSSQQEFYALFDSVTKVYRDGTLVKPVTRVNSYTADGDVSISGGKILISSHQSHQEFLKE